MPASAFGFALIGAGALFVCSSLLPVFEKKGRGGSPQRSWVSLLSLSLGLLFLGLATRRTLFILPALGLSLVSYFLGRFYDFEIYCTQRGHLTPVAAAARKQDRRVCKYSFLIFLLTAPAAVIVRISTAELADPSLQKFGFAGVILLGTVGAMSATLMMAFGFRVSADRLREKMLQADGKS